MQENDIRVRIGNSPVLLNKNGDMWHNGDGIEKNDIFAFECFEHSASQGNAVGQRKLALMYLLGHGVKQDHDKAFKLFKLSADQNDSDAQYHLGMMYYDAVVTQKDLTEAFRLFSLSVDQKNTDAQYMLGCMYLNGLTVDKNLKKAFSLFKSSSYHGKCEDVHASDSDLRLGEMYRYGHGVEKDLFEATVYYLLSANRGNKQANAELGDVYYERSELLTGHAKMESLKSSVGLNNKKAQFAMATILEHDDKSGEAIELYKLSAEQGYAKAQYRLAMIYLHGTGYINVAEALKLLHLSAKGLNVDAVTCLARMYRTGTNVEKDLIEAIRLLQDYMDRRMLQGDEVENLTNDIQEAHYLLTEIYLEELNQKYSEQSDYVVDLENRPCGPKYLEAQTSFEESAKLSL